jgi:predicted DCC family thiol-disulfide oxidoreductase YuxK
MISGATSPWPDDDVILYDGVCVFCSRRIHSSRRVTWIIGFVSPRFNPATGWRWMRGVRQLPKPLRDAGYNLIARNRYRIFGKYEVCFVPDAELRKRVVE